MAAETFQGRFLHAGASVDYTPSGTALVPGEVVVDNGLFGIAIGAIPVGKLGALQVAGVANIVKVTGALARGLAIYWDDDGDPLGGSAGTGCATSTSTSNTFIGFVSVAAGASDQVVTAYMVPAIAVTTTGNLAGTIADPDDAGAIAVGGSGSVSLVSVGADETRTLAIPTFVGQQIMLNMKTDAGDIILTVASAWDEFGRTTYTFDEVGQTLGLVGVDVSGTLAWREFTMTGPGHLSDVVADPANGNAIAVTHSGSCVLVSVGAAETRTLAIPTFLGQQISLFMDTDGGDIVITVASAVNEAGNTTLTFAEIGEHIQLVAISIGGTLVWRVAVNDSVVLGS